MAGRRGCLPQRFDTATPSHSIGRRWRPILPLVAAALKGATTSAWLSEYPAGDSLVTLALRRENDLPPLNRIFARGLKYQFAGNGDSALAWFRKVTSYAPEWSEGWYGIGEATYHLWPAGDNLDSVARDAFQRSVDLDPDFAPVVFHLAELTLVGGELDSAARLVSRHRTLSADTDQQLEIEAMLQCLRGGPDARSPGPPLSPGKQLHVNFLPPAGCWRPAGDISTVPKPRFGAALLSPPWIPISAGGGTRASASTTCSSRGES